MQDLPGEDEIGIAADDVQIRAMNPRPVTGDAARVRSLQDFFGDPPEGVPLAYYIAATALCPAQSGVRARKSRPGWVYAHRLALLYGDTHATTCNRIACGAVRAREERGNDARLTAGRVVRPALTRGRAARFAHTRPRGVDRGVHPLRTGRPVGPGE